MMNRYALLSLLLCICNISCCHGKVINTDSSSSYATKLCVGVAQALQWMKDYVVPTKEERQPRKVTLAPIGLGRTGSTSFAAALKQLGYVPVHDDEIPEVSDVMNAMFAGDMTLDDVNEELGRRGFDAPMVNFHPYVEWAATAPDVKVILTVRDSKRKWAESWLSVAPSAFIPEQRPFRWIKTMQEMAAFYRHVMLDVPTNGKPELYQDIPTLEEGYEAWNNFVRQTVPAERLLEFNVKEGWEPLCSFLDKPIPEGPFPHINDRIIVDTIVKVFVVVTWIWPLILVSPFVLLVCGFHLYRRYKSNKEKRE